ncbi:hypothetical protein [Chryseobacterium caseinilyticum]|uniref:Uncharacterized protein n=1 Tax=Chryseobacterium caseinilyticum TaxID=2771428 RepID=A0ABR8Z785_9FLAO|nr:hypothetical protein [Chryseobacterium caseinilyticum]MBD8081136.1 hypothetical protein [Chryseobacterium caseinilyticum]
MDKYYRNIEDITSSEGILVEAGSLWEIQQNDKIANIQILVLVDDDVYATHHIDLELFEETEIN